MRYVLVLLLVVGCSNKYDECLDKEKESYRDKYPNASFAMMSSKQKDFEIACSKFKGK